MNLLYCQLLILILTIQWSTTNSASESELLAVEISVTSANADTNSTQYQECPDDLQVKVKLPTDTVHLSLTRDLALSNVTVNVIRDGEFVPHVRRDTSPRCFYRDADNSAALSYQREHYGSTVKGLFHTSTGAHALRPASTAQRRLKRHTAAGGRHTTAPLHLAYRLNDIGLQAVRQNAHININTRQRRSATAYTVELLIITDYAMYEKFFSTNVDEGEPETATVDDISYFLCHVTNIMNIGFQNIDDDLLDITIVLKHAIILETREDSSFAEGIREPDGTIEADDLKARLDAWLQQHAGELARLSHGREARDVQHRRIRKSRPSGPAWGVADRNGEDYADIDSSLEDVADIGRDERAYYHLSSSSDSAPTVRRLSRPPSLDHAMLLTGLDLFRADNYNIAGIATLSSACRLHLGSLVENSGVYGAAEIGAHELGHVLGSDHDGENGCADIGNIMAPVTEFLREDDNSHRYAFSSCSVDQFLSFISSLGSSRNCLLNGATTFDHSLWETSLELLPGQRFSLDEQCQQMYGEGSYHCMNQRYPERICRKVYCYIPGDDTCRHNARHTTSDGTSCGNHKWCINHVCVEDPAAPAGDDDCIFGDYQRVFTHTHDDVPYRGTCAQLIEVLPRVCYIAELSAQCCGSCNTMYDESNPQCAYGDRAAWCEGMDHGWRCYTRADTCCHSCPQFLTEDPECLYGDRSTWCEENIDHGRWCYNNEELCCGTCQLYQTSDPECPYGNRASWCDSMDHGWPCYTRADDCCQSCPQFLTDNPECLYGDRSTWCEENIDHGRWCYNNEELCCGTCQLYQTSDPDCLYGDRSTWCEENINSGRLCYYNAELCCGTCQQYQTGNPECPYGDRASWCADRIQSGRHCYSRSDTCCGSCQEYLTGDAECLYGDKASWCSIESCDSEENVQICCQSCRKVDTTTSQVYTDTYYISSTSVGDDYTAMNITREETDIRSRERMEINDSNTSVQPITDDSNTSVQPITDDSNTIVQPITDDSNTSVQTTTDNSVAVQPATDDSNTRVQPGTNDSSTSVQPATDESNTSVQTTTDNSVAVQPTIDGSNTRVQPGTDDSSTSVQPTTDDSNTSVLPATDDSNTSVKPANDDSNTSVQPATDDSNISAQPAIDDSS